LRRGERNGEKKRQWKSGTKLLSHPMTRVSQAQNGSAIPSVDIKAWSSFSLKQSLAWLHTEKLCTMVRILHGVNACACFSTSVYTCIHTSIGTYIHTYVYTHTYMCVYVYTYMYIYRDISFYLSTYLSKYIY